MAFNKIYFRVDGNNKIGLGHFYRCIALANMLKDNFDIEFLTKFKSEITSISNFDFDVNEIPYNIDTLNEPEWIAKNIPHNNILVLDGYNYNEQYQQKIKTHPFKLVYIDDLIEEFQNADLVINHTPNITKEQYRGRTDTRFALGLPYAMLRNSFLNFNKKQYSPRNNIQSIFICFGGTDIHDFSYQVSQIVLELDFVKNIHLIIGNSYKHKTIFELNSPKINIHHNLSEQKLYNLMLLSDLAIVPASTISIELASLGVPMILGYSAENQLNIYNGLKNENVFLTIGDYSTYDFKKLKSHIKDINSREKLNKQNILALFNGNPADNIRKEFDKFKVSMKQADTTDLLFIYELANDTLVRENSFNSKKINISEHRVWFQKQLNSLDVLFLIIIFEKAQIGQVRFDIKKEFAIIGISIIKKFRNRGLSSTILRKATNTFHKKSKLPVYAYIKNSNLASIKSFINAGYKYFKKEEINNISSNIYKKENIEN